MPVRGDEPPGDAEAHQHRDVVLLLPEDAPVVALADLDVVVEEAHAAPSPGRRPTRSSPGRRTADRGGCGRRASRRRRRRRSRCRPSSACPAWPCGARGRGPPCRGSAGPCPRVRKNAIRHRVPNSDTNVADGAGDHDGDHGRVLQQLAGDGPVVERRGPRRRSSGCVSWPLPAMTTTSPGRRVAERRARSPPGGRARPRRRSRSSAAHAAERSASMIASGSSRARVVGCHDHPIGAARAATAPISGRLSRSRSPPQPNTTIDAARSATGRAAREHARSRPSGVWA